MTKWIFITGGCSYIGSHLAAQLKTLTDYSILLIDKNGTKYPHITRYCDIFADEEFYSAVIDQAIYDYKPECIIHCADEHTINDINDPLTVWETNVTKTINLLRTCSKINLEKFIYISTSDIYAQQDQPKTEQSKILPLTTYARSKLAIEHVLKDCYISYGINNISFRPFNIAGAHNLYDIGHLKGSPFLIPQIVESTINGSSFEVFGNNFNTPDKTAIRDYLHILDLTDLIIKSISWMSDNQGSFMFNAASGKSISVQDVINNTEQLIGKNLSYSYSDRRYYEPAIHTADISLLSSTFGFVPTRTIADIIKDSIKWYNSLTYKQLSIAGLSHTL